MREAMRRRLASEEGISLVEIMVAFAVLTLILIGFAATLISSLHALVGNESRTKANALANDVLEAAQQEPWEDLAIGTDTWDDGPYTVTRETAWADDTSVSGLDDYLEFTVTIDWEDLGVSRTVTHEARRSPPVRDIEEAATVRSLRADAEIGYLRRNVEDSSVHGRLDERVEFNDDGDAVASSLNSNEGVNMTLTTTLPVESVSVELVDRLGNTETGDLEEKNAPEGTEWELSGTVTNNWRYLNGDNTFTFTLTTGSDTFTSTKVVRYVFEHVEVIDGPSADPQPVCLDDNGEGLDAVELDVHFWGLTVDDLVEVTGAGLDATEEWLAVHAETTDDGSVFAFTLPAGHAYPAGESTIVEMVGTRGFDGKTNLDDDSDEGSPPDPAEVELQLLRPGDDGYDTECVP